MKLLKKVIDYEKCPEECGQDKGDGRYRGRGPKKFYGKAEVSITAQGCVSVCSKARYTHSHTPSPTQTHTHTHTHTYTHTHTNIYIYIYIYIYNT